MNPGKGRAIAKGLFVFATACSIMGIGGCGSKPESKAGQKSRELGTLTPVTATASGDTATSSPQSSTSSTVAPADHAEMKFFTEQYLPTNERLQRRQARLRESLNNPAASE